MHAIEKNTQHKLQKIGKVVFKSHVIHELVSLSLFINIL
jgi:hypothetical protein